VAGLIPKQPTQNEIEQKQANITNTFIASTDPIVSPVHTVATSAMDTSSSTISSTAAAAVSASSSSDPNPTANVVLPPVPLDPSHEIYRTILTNVFKRNITQPLTYLDIGAETVRMNLQIYKHWLQNTTFDKILIKKRKITDNNQTTKNEPVTDVPVLISPDGGAPASDPSNPLPSTSTSPPPATTPSTPTPSKYYPEKTHKTPNTIAEWRKFITYHIQSAHINAYTNHLFTLQYRLEVNKKNQQIQKQINIQYSI
jgi:hypothetical protein